MMLMATADNYPSKADTPLAHEAVKVDRLTWKAAVRPLSGGVFLDLIGFDALCAYPYALNALRSVYPHLLEIWKPDFLGLVLCMGNIMPCLSTFSTNITPS
jgi:hypothetical protein